MPSPEVLSTLQEQQRPRSADASISCKKVTSAHRSKDQEVVIVPQPYLPSQPVHLVAQHNVRATFRVEVETLWGDQVLLVGSSVQTGAWQPEKTSIALKTDKSLYPVWTATMDLEAPIEYKVVVARASRSQHAGSASHRPLFEWEPIENRTLSQHAHHAGKAAHISLVYAQPGGRVSWRWEW